MSRNSLLEAGAKSKVWVTATGLEPRTTSFRKLCSVGSLWNGYVIWQEHTVKCTVQRSTQNTVQSAKWLMFVYELSGSGLESSCSQLNFRFRACFVQGVPWHSGNYTVWIHSDSVWIHAYVTWQEHSVKNYTRVVSSNWTNCYLYKWSVYKANY